MKVSLYYFRELYRTIRRFFVFFVIRLGLYKKNTINDEFMPELLENKWSYINPGCVQYSFERTEENTDVDLSIIIPLYNSERYLPTLVEMLENQQTNYIYEVLFVDDGSSDDSYRHIKELTAMNHIFKCFRKENGGIADARNYGLAKAGGKYIAFIDHDDEVTLSFVQEIIDATMHGKYKIVKCQYYQKYNNTLIGPFSSKGYIWGGAFDRALFRYVQFPVGFWYEDMINNFLICAQTKSVNEIESALYYKSSTKINASKKMWSSNNYKCLEHIYLVDSLIRDYKKLGLTDVNYLFHRVLFECSTLAVSRTKNIDNTTRRQVFLFCRKLVLENEIDSNIRDELSIKERLFYNAFKNKDFKAWELLAKI